MTLAEKYLKSGGSVTLTSGFLSHYPNLHSLGTGPFNAAIDTYVRQASSFLKNDLRLNVVSPAPVVEPSRVGKVYRAWGGLPVPAEQ